MNKRNATQYPLSNLNFWPVKSFIFLFFLTLASGCLDANKTKSKTGENTSETTAKQVVELIYTDGGAVVPNPVERKIVVSLRDSANPMLSYSLIQGDAVTQKNDFKLSGAQRDEMVDNVAALSEIPDGLEYKPGKSPCVGARGVEVQMVFNNGDTSRFTISGGARCDRDIAAPWKVVDSIATEIFKTGAQ